MSLCVCFAFGLGKKIFEGDAKRTSFGRVVFLDVLFELALLLKREVSLNSE